MQIISKLAFTFDLKFDELLHHTITIISLSRDNESGDP